MSVTELPYHYVPVLKVKPAEKKALDSIEFRARKMITPLLEIVERKPKNLKKKKGAAKESAIVENEVGPKPTMDEHLDKAFRQLDRRLLGYSRCFIDSQEIASDESDAAQKTFCRAAENGISFVPVTGISRVADVDAALTYRDRGIALRLSREDCASGNLESELRRFMRLSSLSAREIDIIVDLGDISELVEDGADALARGLIDEVPEHESWRTFTVSASAFPSSMSVVGKNSMLSVPRLDWSTWHSQFYERRARMRRLPHYSDCGIQHSAGVEGFKPGKMHPAPSIRYATADSWLLIKGEGTQNLPPRVQYPELVKSYLIGDRGFYGGSHCGGCQEARMAFDGGKCPSSPGEWRRIGAIHHITVIVNALRGLAWP